MSRPVTIWPRERVAEVRRLCNEPDRPVLRVIAQQVGVSEAAITAIIHKHGIAPAPLRARETSRWTPERLAEATALLTALGRPSIAAIAEGLGISKNCLSGLIDRKKIRLSPGPADRGETLTYKPRARLDPSLRAKPKSRAKPRPAPMQQPVSDRPADKSLRPHVPSAAKLKRMAAGNTYGVSHGGFPSAAKQLRLAAEAKVIRADMDRMIQDAIAAGKVTKLPPGHAIGVRGSHVMEGVSL